MPHGALIDNVYFQRGRPSGFSFETLYWDGPYVLTAAHTDDECTLVMT